MDRGIPPVVSQAFCEKKLDPRDLLDQILFIGGKKGEMLKHLNICKFLTNNFFFEPLQVETGYLQDFFVILVGHELGSLLASKT